MPSVKRRQLLVALGGLSALGGCSSPSGTGRTSSNPVRGSASHDGSPLSATATTSATTRPTTPKEGPSSTFVTTVAADFEFVVAVLRQPSERAPGRLRASLTNHRDAPLAVAGGDPVPISGDIEQVAASSPLVLFPDLRDSINEYRYVDTHDPASIEDAVRDGCWQLPDAYYMTAAGQGVKLPPGASAVADLFPLGHPDSPCPEGLYESADELTVRALSEPRPTSDGDSRLWGRIHVTLRIRVAASGSIFVTGDLDVERS